MTQWFNTVLLAALGLTIFSAGCHKPPPEQPPAEQLLRLQEVKPYPAMDTFTFENISFGFALKLSELPEHITDTPKRIDIEKTIHGNMGHIDYEGIEDVQSLLECIRNGEISGISVNGVENKTFSLTGEASRQGSAAANRDVTYSIETTKNLEMLSLKKETRYSKQYLLRNGFDRDAFIGQRIKIYGNPHYTHVKANGSGTFSHYWWGADEDVLLADKGYDYLNASHWNGFRGKTFFVSIHKYRSGDIVIGEIMKDNFRAFHNQLKE